jgi:hypothetical protein
LKYPGVDASEPDGNREHLLSKLKVLQGEPSEVRQLLSSDRIVWHLLKVRDTEMGVMDSVFCPQGMPSKDEIPFSQAIWLLIYQELDGSGTKFSFSNSKDSPPIETLAEWQGR